MGECSVVPYAPRDKNLECTGDQTAQVLRFKQPRAEYLLTYDVDLV